MMHAQSSAARALRWLPIIIAVPYTWFALNNYHYELDDALIYMRYIQNFVEGRGLAYNPGEHFDGLTSPLFSYLTAAVAFVSRSARFATWVLSALPMYLAFGVLYSVWRRQLGFAAPAAPLAASVGLVIAATLPYFFSTYGMETGLFLSLVALTLEAYLERRWERFWLLGTLLVLTRPEGMALLGACGLYYLCSTRAWPPIRTRQVAIAIGLVAAVVAANLFFFHTPWAETGAAKIWQGKSGYWGDGLIFWNIEYLQNLAFGSDGAIEILLLVGTVVGILAMGFGELNIVLLVFLLCYFAFFTIFNVPNYHWYYSVFFLFLPYWCATGYVYLAATLIRGDRGVRTRVLGTAILCVGVYPVDSFIALDATKVESSGARYARAGRWIDANTPPGSTLAAAEIGALGWYSKRPIVDILGLVNPGNARRIGERDFDGWTSDYRPDYLLVHDPPVALELALYNLISRYSVTQICDFKVDGYLLYHVKYEAEPSRFCKPGFELRRITIASTPVLAAKDPGHIDSITVLGNYVRMTGWATGGIGKPFASLVVPEKRGIDFGIYERYERPDVARYLSDPGYEHSGFNLLLRFPSFADARAFAAAPCLLSRRDYGAVPLNDVACSAGLPFRGGFEAAAAGPLEDAVAGATVPPPPPCETCPTFKSGFEERTAPVPGRP